MVSTTDFLFLHGGGQGGWVWEETITALRLQDAGMIGTTMALDMPGCGSKRGRDTATMSLSQACEELAHDIDSTGVKDAILVGHSQAGTVMPQLAAARPHAVHHLVYVSCCAPAPGQTVLEMMGGGDGGWEMCERSVTR
jgi:pimeloyl-ACP methyl ester carboxylesterase